MPSRYLLCVALLVWSSSAAAWADDQPMYVADSANHLLTVDPATGHADLVGSMLAQFTDIAFGPSGRLYGITSTLVYEIDPSSGWSDLIGEHGYGYLPNSYGIDALTFGHDGVLYAAGDDVVIAIDTATGAGTTIGSLSGYTSAGDMAADNSGRLLLTTDAGTLVEVHPNGSGATPVGQLPYTDVFALARSPDGNLYGIRSNNDILTVDPDTGSADYVAGLHADFLIGRAWGASFPDRHVPEPSMLLLMAFGAACLVSRRRP